MSIAIAEKHVREVVRPFNIYDDYSAEAVLNMLMARQSGHRPLQRGITYGLDATYPTRLQPALLRAYEWASTRWDDFLRQASRVVVAQQRLQDVQHSGQQPMRQKRAFSQTMPEGSRVNKQRRSAGGIAQRGTMTAERPVPEWVCRRRWSRV